MADEPAKPTPDTMTAEDLIKRAEALITSAKESGLKDAGAILTKHFTGKGITYVSERAVAFVGDVVDALRDSSTRKNSEKKAP